SPLERVRTAGRALWASAAAADVRRTVAEWRPDVVHVHNVFPTLSPLVVREAARHVPVVLTLHNYRQLCIAGTLVRDGRICESCVGRSPAQGVLHACYRGDPLASLVVGTSIALHRAAGSYAGVALYLAVSEFVRSKHVEAGFPARAILVKPNFAWPAARRTGPGGYFLFLGRLAREKGLGDLLAAWRTIEAPLVVAGDGPQRLELEAAAPRNFGFRGSVSPDEVPGLLRGARALVVPSRWYEGAPRVVIEAYAAGVPVIASRLGGLAQTVDDGVSGVLVAPGDAGGWRRAVG